MQLLCESFCIGELTFKQIVKKIQNYETTKLRVEKPNSVSSSTKKIEIGNILEYFGIPIQKKISSNCEICQRIILYSFFKLRYLIKSPFNRSESFFL